MNLLLIIFLLLIFFAIYYIVVNKIRVDLKSFFKKGFKKIDNTFRALLLCRKTTVKEKHIALLSF